MGFGDILSLSYAVPTKDPIASEASYDDQVSVLGALHGGFRDMLHVVTSLSGATTLSFHSMSQGHPPAQQGNLSPSHSVLNGKVSTSSWPFESGPPSCGSPASTSQEPSVNGPSGQGSPLTTIFASNVPAQSYSELSSRAPGKVWRRSTHRFKGYRNAEDLLWLAETAVAVGACTVRCGAKYVVFEKLGQAMHAKGVEGSDAVFSKRLNGLLLWYETSGGPPDHIRETLDMGGVSVRDKITASLRILSEQKQKYAKEQSLQLTVSNLIKMEPDDGKPGFAPVVARFAKTPKLPVPRPVIPSMTLPPIYFLPPASSGSSSVSASPPKPCEVTTAVAEPNPFLATPVTPVSCINPQLLYQISPESPRFSHPYNRPVDPSTALRSFSMSDISDLLNMESAKPQAESTEPISECRLNTPLFSKEPVSRPASPGVTWVPLPNKPSSADDPGPGGVPSESNRIIEVRGTKRTRDDDEEDEWHIRGFLEADQRERREREELLLKEICEIGRRQQEGMEHARAFREDAMKVLRRINIWNLVNCYVETAVMLHGATDDYILRVFE